MARKASALDHLNECQSRALETLNTGENVFLTGSAGSGKSFLIRHFLKGALASSKDFPVLASTGAAAILVGGRTFHSFFGLGIMQGGYDATIERALENKRVVKRLKKTQGLVIDEISMLGGITLRAAEQICRQARESDMPWGGIRVVTVGDFAQLPPVDPYRKDRDWAFQDPSWFNSDFKPAILRTIMRTEDPDFLRILNFVRNGILNPEVREFLNARTVPPPKGFDGTRLFPLRQTTERYNLERLDQVGGQLHSFNTMYLGDSKSIETLKKYAPIPEIIQLKEGALVLLRQNDPLGRWVNGSLGTVFKIEKDKLKIDLQSGLSIELEPASFSLLDSEGKEVAAARNFPINLAYATTIHKAQGMTIDRLIVDLQNLWEPGQAYVALSRVRSSAGLYVSGWTPNSIKMDPMVRDFYHAFELGE